jgi:hypothetical protein
VLFFLPSEVGTTMAAAMATADRRIVSIILHHLSDMKYKDRQQPGPDQPVELLEFRPTLLPSILVNKQVWAEEGTSILWKRYPHLPALRVMTPDRRQWYANKVERLFVFGPSPESGDDLAYLDGLEWPRLKILELDVDWKTHGSSIGRMLHPGLEKLEFLGPQSGNSDYIAGTVLPELFTPCTNLHSIHFGPDAIDPVDPVLSQELINLLEFSPSITEVRILNAGIFEKDILFGRLSQRRNLEALEIDLDPGLQLLPCFTGPNALPAPFAFLKHLHLMCYPEIALVLPFHLQLIEDVQLDLARIPSQPRQATDLSVLDDILGELSQCRELRKLRVNVGQLALDFPSTSLHPNLSGMALLKLATGCSKLHDINLLASEPAGIDGSMISSSHFDAFCRKLPELISLGLKLHPRTTFHLEATALQSLGRHCPRLESLRLKVALQLPTLVTYRESSPTSVNDSPLQEPWETNKTNRPPSIAVNGLQRVPPLESEHLKDPVHSHSLFEHLTHLAFARPQSILSITSDTYTVSSTSRSSSVVDAVIEEDLVRTWAQPLSAHFPRLEVLEGWGDWTGQDNESLNYYLPLVEVLASMWEFLSGAEQDLWEDGDDLDVDEVEEWEDSRQGRFSMDSQTSLDWELASMINEFRVDGDVESSCVESYDEEEEDMITPGRTLENAEEGYFERGDGKGAGLSTATLETGEAYSIHASDSSSTRVA